MCKKWKSMTALGMAALLGCLVPMGTMMAAEDNTEAVQESEADPVSDTDEVYGGESDVDENENAGDEIDADAENTDNEVNAGDENVGDEAENGNEADAGDENAGDGVNENDVNTEDEVSEDNANTEDEVNEVDADVEDITGTYSDGNEGIEVMSETEEPEAGDTEEQELAAPVIDITLNGTSCKVDGLGGKIDYKYVNNLNQMFEFSANQGDQKAAFYYYLDSTDDINDMAMEEGDIEWSDGAQYSPMTMVLENNKKYVLYVKAVGTDGQTAYARSCGVVVDTITPKIVGLDEGKAYPEGTTFKVEEVNLESVKVNETLVTPESDGSYQVIANGTSCVIRVKDKAGNEKICSIIVTARTPDENGVISVNGTYSLEAGTSYQLAEGKWQVYGDSTVYQGGSVFYVKTDGDYRFTKRWE